MRDQGPAASLQGSIVAPHFFDVIGVQPALGAGFREDHGRAGTDDVAILSDALWRSRFGADPDVIGTTVRLDGRTYTIQGVMPADYRHPERDYAHTQVWVPLALNEAAPANGRFLRVLGRLRDDVSLARAREELSGLATRLSEADPASNEGWGVRLVPLEDQLFGAVRPGVRLLLAAAGFVLLVVCVNVANLMLARGRRRGREFAIRAAVGGGRTRLAVQVLVEAAVVVIVGGAVGLGLVYLSLDVLRDLQSNHVSWIARLGIDGCVVGFTLAVSGLAVVGAGLVPALRSARPELRSFLLSGTASSGGSRRTREGLIIVEVTLTVVLLVSAMLLTRSFVRLTGTDVGFTPDRVLTMELELPVEGYGPERLNTAYGQILERVEAMAGVERVGLVSDLPFTTWNSSTSVSVGSPPDPGGQAPTAEVKVVGGDYFGAMGIDRIQGEDRSPAAVAGAEAVVINRAMAGRFWEGADPIGASVYLGSRQPTAAVVSGVVSDVLDDGYNSGPEPRVYRSLDHQPRRGMVLVVRATRSPLALAEPISRAIQVYDRDIAVARIRPMSAVVAGTVADRSLVLAVVMGFGGLALLLAAVGIYGVVSYNVEARTAELAIRASLGADPGDLVTMVVRHSVKLAGLGLIGGTGLALMVAPLIRSLLYGVTELDAVSYGIVALAIAVTAFLAAWVPARRAAGVEPMQALRLDV